MSVSHSIRRMFYLITPSETSYATVDDVPPESQTVPWLLVFVVVDWIFSYLSGHKDRYNPHDSLLSLSSSVLHMCIKGALHSLDILFYDYIFRNYALIHLPWDSSWTWWASFFAVDFGYYWLHRAAHEINILWAIHQLHHSSQYYNLTTAMRLVPVQVYGYYLMLTFVFMYMESVLTLNALSKDEIKQKKLMSFRMGMFQQYMGMFFYLPAALFIPTQVHLVHLMSSLFFQFWLHTSSIDRIPFMEYIFNTPSHHRVHHGRNRQYIDRNYGSVLIIWDRMFGTYIDEDRDDPPIYGLVETVKSYGTLYVQFFYFKKALWDKPRSVPGFTNKLKAVFYGPGWVPGTGRLGNNADIPDIESPVQIYDVESELWEKLYILIHGSFCFVTYYLIEIRRKTMSWPEVFLYSGSIFVIMYNLGSIVERKKYYKYYELVRCAVMTHWIGETILWSTGIYPVDLILKTTVMLSEAHWLYSIARQKFH